MSLKFKLKHISSTRAYASCPSHRGGTHEAPVEIQLYGDYVGRAYCFSCGKVWQLTKGQVEKLRKMAPKKKKTSNNLYEIYRSFAKSSIYLEKLAKQWNVNPHCLLDLGILWSGSHYLIPMYNEDTDLCGIQYRYPDGFKRCAEGSALGLFMPEYGDESETLFITEGCSDLACLLDLGFDGIGRPNCNSCVDLICGWIDKNVYPGPQLICIADNDIPGVEGANQLCEVWNECHQDWKMDYIQPLHGKDLREFVELEGKEKVRGYLKGSC